MLTYDDHVPTVEPDQAVLVVEDERNIRDLVCLHLGIEGFTCVPVGNGTDAVAAAHARAFALVILDVMLPGLDGISVCRSIRRGTMNADVPILMLTARREESDKVVGLDSGADDYLTKPFGVRELMARVRALLRRRTAPAAPAQDAPLRHGHIEVDPARRRVQVHGREVALTSHEFSLLATLLARPGIVFSRDALLRRIWDEDTYVTVRSVDTLVKRVRRKIEDDPANPQVVLTVWGTGYKVADEPL